MFPSRKSRKFRPVAVPQIPVLHEALPAPVAELVAKISPAGCPARRYLRQRAKNAVQSRKNPGRPVLDALRQANDRVSLPPKCDRDQIRVHADWRSAYL